MRRVQECCQHLPPATAHHEPSLRPYSLQLSLAPTWTVVTCHTALQKGTTASHPPPPCGCGCEQQVQCPW